MVYFIDIVLLLSVIVVNDKEKTLSEQKTGIIYFILILSAYELGKEELIDEEDKNNGIRSIINKSFYDNQIYTVENEKLKVEIQKLQDSNAGIII